MLKGRGPQGKLTREQEKVHQDNCELIYLSKYHCDRYWDMETGHLKEMNIEPPRDWFKRIKSTLRHAVLRCGPGQGPQIKIEQVEGEVLVTDEPLPDEQENQAVVVEELQIKEEPASL